MERATIAIDLAKRVFQIHFVDPAGTIHRKALKGAQALQFFANRPATWIVTEAARRARSRSDGWRASSRRRRKARRATGTRPRGGLHQGGSTGVEPARVVTKRQIIRNPH